MKFHPLTRISQLEPFMVLQTQTHGDGVLVIQYQTDNLDASNATDFRDAMHGILDTQHKLVLDMTPLKFVDSSGLSALIACLRESHKQRGDFRLAAVSQPVAPLFELMRMHRVFSIHDSVDAAVRSYA